MLRKARNSNTAQPDAGELVECTKVCEQLSQQKAAGCHHARFVEYEAIGSGHM